MSEQTQRPPQDEPPDSTAEDETEVVPHSEDCEEQLPWCVGNFG